MKPSIYRNCSAQLLLLSRLAPPPPATRARSPPSRPRRVPSTAAAASRGRAGSSGGQLLPPPRRRPSPPHPLPWRRRLRRRRGTSGASATRPRRRRHPLFGATTRPRRSVRLRAARSEERKAKGAAAKGRTCWFPSEGRASSEAGGRRRRRRRRQPRGALLLLLLPLLQQLLQQLTLSRPRQGCPRRARAAGRDQNDEFFYFRFPFLSRCRKQSVVFFKKKSFVKRLFLPFFFSFFRDPMLCNGLIPLRVFQESERGRKKKKRRGS